MKQFSHLVFIGRFSPFHNGHLGVVSRALEISENLIILVGSSNIARNPVTPFTFEERRDMILESLQQIYGESIKYRLSILPIFDYPYNDTMWTSHVQMVAKTAARKWTDGKIRIGLIGHSKDKSSFYLKLFPDWESVDVPAFADGLSATDIRKYYFASERDAVAIMNTNLMPNGTLDFLSEFAHKKEHQWIAAEKTFYENYGTPWKDIPYNKGVPHIICADNVVLQSGYVLLIERRNSPGKGLLALPGGHVENDQTFMDAAVSELRQETKISDSLGIIPPAKLKSFITNSRIFDHPKRSLRGKVVTMAYRYDLPPATKLYKVKGDDDAAFAKWFAIDTLDPRDFFEDHAAILDTLANTNVQSQVKFN